MRVADAEGGCEGDDWGCPACGASEAGAAVAVAEAKPPQLLHLQLLLQLEQLLAAGVRVTPANPSTAIVAAAGGAAVGLGVIVAADGSGAIGSAGSADAFEGEV